MRALTPQQSPRAHGIHMESVNLGYASHYYQCLSLRRRMKVCNQASPPHHVPSSSGRPSWRRTRTPATM